MRQQHVDGRQRRRAGQRVAAERGGMQERVIEQHREYLFGGDRCANRHDAAAQRFGKAQNVRLDVFMLAGEHLAGAPHAGLHFIEDQQRAKLVAQLAHRGQIARRRQNHPAFALNRLKDHRRDVIAGLFALAQQGAHRVDIAKRHVTESRQQRHKRLTESRFRGGRKRAQRLTVKRVAGGDEGKLAARRLISLRQL